MHVHVHALFILKERYCLEEYSANYIHTSLVYFIGQLLFHPKNTLKKPSISGLYTETSEMYRWGINSYCNLVHNLWWVSPLLCKYLHNIETFALVVVQKVAPVVSHKDTCLGF